MYHTCRDFELQLCIIACLRDINVPQILKLKAQLKYL